MHPSQYAASTPDTAAVIMADSGETLTYRQLDDRSNQLAQLFRAQGLVRGDVIAILLENHPRYFEACWAAQRSGLYFVGISSKLNADEAAYIIEDSEAKLLITSAAMTDIAAPLAERLSHVHLYMLDGAIDPYQNYEASLEEFLARPITDESAGSDMLYSSGTTGRPKGIKPALPEAGIDAVTPLHQVMTQVLKLKPGCVYLSPAPLYHSSPLRWCMGIHRLGGTVVVMEKFRDEQVLQLIERYKVQSAQFVPTHFQRLLKLESATKQNYELNSLEAVVHAGAPCAATTKRQMIDWWGPIIHEFYAGTEGNGLCYINSEQWLSHPGSVGRPVVGKLHICNDEGEPVAPGEEGLIYFEDGPQFHYHNDAQKTAEAHNQHGWSTLGDVGRVDEEGYLYLTDRKSFMIISGGVNVYPQEIEDLFIAHPKVADVAVIGAPDEDMGERVVAVIQLEAGHTAGERLSEELVNYGRQHLSHIKAPRQVDFVSELPRHDTGKLYKRLIRDQYWQGRNSKLI
ncbi:acyl-CoA synthetase [Pseudomaricurvus alkylphenolicus]|uniref:acyl-CoA synthetase n=1 Tax=Pseudomaricurvus alkylphenolicus TaxID=1306991 RepID=UPI001422E7D9|nr:acyl-CoA synthetase [Pseudomaricurvus alkylphenolicus]NIB40501.1 acyl-CoA synthetase [Pseudomaricurvus alkylphenolicus]